MIKIRDPNPPIHTNTQIKNKFSQNRKQGGLGRASEDMGPLNNLNILSFQENKEELVRSFHSLPIPPNNSKGLHSEQYSCFSNQK